MKKFFLSLTVAACACSALAQRSGINYMLPATNYVQAGTTNSSVSAWTNNAGAFPVNGVQHPAAILNVSEYERIGVTCQASPKTPVNSTSTFVFCQSFDGGITFESVPSIRVPCVLNGLTGWGGGSVGVTGATHIAIFTIENPSGADLSNATIVVNLKSPKVLRRQATQ